jgi:hypothetical protein
MSSVAQTPAPRPGRQLEYRWFLAGVECTAEEFFAELRRLGGKAQVEVVDLGAQAPAHRRRPQRARRP